MIFDPCPGALAEIHSEVKERNSFGSHGDQRAAFRVSSLARTAVLNDETTESTDLDPVSLRESVHHGIKNCVNDHFRISSRKMRKSFVHLIDQISFCHKHSPSRHKKVIHFANRSRSAANGVTTATIHSATSSVPPSAGAFQTRQKTSSPTNVPAPHENNRPPGSPPTLLAPRLTRWHHPKSRTGLPNPTVSPALRNKPVRRRAFSLWTRPSPDPWRLR